MIDAYAAMTNSNRTTRRFKDGFRFSSAPEEIGSGGIDPLEEVHEVGCNHHFDPMPSGIHSAGIPWREGTVRIVDNPFRTS